MAARGMKQTPWAKSARRSAATLEAQACFTRASGAREG